MDEHELLAARFKSHETHLRGVAYRMLGSLSEADDALQDAWLHFNRADTTVVANLRGWLTTVVARICLDMLRARKSRREEPLQSNEPDTHTGRRVIVDPEEEALLADSVGVALLVVLQKLAPAERIAFVLHDLFDLPFDEIAAIVGRSPTATRQLASRARRRVRGGAETSGADVVRQREVVDAFMTAARGGDMAALLAVLDPDVVFRADDAAARAGAASELRGGAAVAKTFSGRAQGARPALVDGRIGLLVAPAGRLFVVLALAIKDGRIARIDAVADPARLRQMNVTLLDD